ncbi:hypothetical protein [Pseudotabrizicola sp. 4114]|uniref:hypothetical protein n=1 Tax=Pseudotabrizicola sp. 4114 TaxID=2817731 RepID=UPI0028629B14|nr:hypothetical protein [Pseudorhodobacter sp. 4114]
MQPIDHARFLERLFTLLVAAKADPESGGTTVPPATAQGQSCRTFAEVYGDDQRLLISLANAVRANGDIGMVNLLVALEIALSDGTLDLAASDKPAQRLLGYVYPVV